MLNSDDNFYLGIGFLVVLVCIVFLLLNFYDTSKLEHIQFKVTLIDKYHKDGECYPIGNNGNYSCDSDTYGLVLKASDRLFTEDRISDRFWQSVPVGSNLIYAYDQGLLGWHHNLNIYPVKSSAKNKL